MKSEIILNEKEQKLIELLREIAYGQVVIFLDGNKPVRIEVDRIKESIKL